MTEIALIITALAALVGALTSAAALIIGVLNADKINQTSADVRKIEVATNSMKDQLVAATAKGEHAAGVTQGRADAAAEAREEE